MAQSYEKLPPWNKPFAEQLAFFKQKLKLPSERWDDILKSAHDKAFIVAGVQSADLLNDLHTAIATAIEKGTGLAAFKKDFNALIKKHGWTGWTGEGSAAGRAWRAKVIYQTNASTSYAAGRWQQLNDPDLLKSRPYWQYKHQDGLIYPRPLHQSWNGLTLPYDHVFWQTHFAPNGWGCHCRVIAVRKEDFMLAITNGRGPANAPALGDLNGIDNGFAYAPGANVEMSLRQAVQDKLIKYPPAISRALSKDINKRIIVDDLVKFINAAIEKPEMRENLFLGFVENYEKLNEVLPFDTKGYMVILKSEYAVHVKKSHEFDGGEQRPPEPKDYLQVISALNSADEIILSRLSKDNLPTLKVIKKIGGEVMTMVFEVRPGQKNKALYLLTLYIKK